MSKVDEISKDSNEQVPLLEVKNLHKWFWMERKRIDVLCGATCSIKPAETIAIVGASGAGKSTLLHILGTLDTPSHGELYINGQDILSLSEEELADFRNRTIGFVFQAHYLLPEFTAVENVMMPTLINRMPKATGQARAKELLDWVGLSHRLGHRPGELSGGERQRVALCRALIMRPRILLADEPTGNLDSQTADGIHALLMSLNREWQVTPIIVTHNSVLAGKMQRSFHLTEGMLEEHVTDSSLSDKPLEQPEVSVISEHSVEQIEISRVSENSAQAEVISGTKGILEEPSDTKTTIQKDVEKEENSNKMVIKEAILEDVFSTLFSQGYDFSKQDFREVIEQYKIVDSKAFSLVTVGLEDDNKSLSREEIENAAKVFVESKETQKKPKKSEKEQTKKK